jgi:N-glycosylase/DNA lyase
VSLAETFLPVRDYDLAGTLTSGQAFRWETSGDGWEGVIGGQWVRLRGTADGIHAMKAAPGPDWAWLEDYLQARVELAPVLASFPDDEPMTRAVNACRGLRLLRQEPWECLASFILSSTKQIVQIRQIVAALCERFGEPVPVPPGLPARWSFPTAERLAACTEADLRGCKMGFRAPYLLETARMVASGAVDLEQLRQVDVDTARTELIRFPGVGRKIADCVLLFAYGFPGAFPVDVWVLRALRELYFPRRRVTPQRILNFTRTHFGPHAGYAQQYLFHYMRTAGGE